MILITEGAGFIGLNFVKYITKFVSIKDVIVVDKLTYASNGAELAKTKVMHYCEDIIQTLHISNTCLDGYQDEI